LRQTITITRVVDRRPRVEGRRAQTLPVSGRDWVLEDNGSPQSTSMLVCEDELRVQKTRYRLCSLPSGESATRVVLSLLWLNEVRGANVEQWWRCGLWSGEGAGRPCQV